MHDYLVHKETAFFCGNLGGHHGKAAILLTSPSVSSHLNRSRLMLQKALDLIL